MSLKSRAPTAGAEADALGEDGRAGGLSSAAGWACGVPPRPASPSSIRRPLTYTSTCRGPAAQGRGMSEEHVRGTRV